MFTGNLIGECFNESLYEVFLQNSEHVKIKTTILNTYNCPSYVAFIFIKRKLSKDKYVIYYKKINI